MNKHVNYNFHEVIINLIQVHVFAYLLFLLGLSTFLLILFCLLLFSEKKKSTPYYISKNYLNHYIGHVEKSLSPMLCLWTKHWTCWKKLKSYALFVNFDLIRTYRQIAKNPCYRSISKTAYSTCMKILV